MLRNPSEMAGFFMPCKAACQLKNTVFKTSQNLLTKKNKRSANNECLSSNALKHCCLAVFLCVVNTKSDSKKAEK